MHLDNLDLSLDLEHLKIEKSKLTIHVLKFWINELFPRDFTNLWSNSHMLGDE